jgi:hypothetical protein
MLSGGSLTFSEWGRENINMVLSEGLKDLDKAYPIACEW